MKKFSHDRVPAELFNYVVTELGKMTPKQIKDLYFERYEKQERMRQEFFTDDEEAIDF